MERCVIASKSMTMASKAQNILHEHAIVSKIVKIDPHLSSHGCSFGVEVNCAQIENAKKLLDKNRVPYSKVVYPD